MEKYFKMSDELKKGHESKFLLTKDDLLEILDRENERGNKSKGKFNEGYAWAMELCKKLVTKLESQVQPMLFSSFIKTLDPWQIVCVHSINGNFVDDTRKAVFFNIINGDFKIKELWSGIDSGCSLIYVKLEIIQ